MKENILNALMILCIVSITLFTGIGAFNAPVETGEASLGGSAFMNDFPSVSRSTSVSVNPNASVEVAPANVARQYLVISNNGASSVYLTLGSGATLNSGILISASSTYTIDADALYTGTITARATATTTVLVTEK